MEVADARDAEVRQPVRRRGHRLGYGRAQQRHEPETEQETVDGCGTGGPYHAGTISVAEVTG
jgi:hypothetical protein